MPTQNSNHKPYKKQQAFKKNRSLEGIIVGTLQQMGQLPPDDRPERGRPRFVFGMHADRFGFWAYFYWDDPDELASIRASAGSRTRSIGYPAEVQCEPNSMDMWYDVGHGPSMKMAVIEAAALVFGEIDRSRSDPKKFLRTNSMLSPVEQDLKFTDSRSARHAGPSRFKINGAV